MKSKVSKKTNYVEMPLKEFAERFPKAYALLPPVFDISDSEYIVRIKDGLIEVGYAGDDWFTE